MVSMAFGQKSKYDAHKSFRRKQITATKTNRVGKRNPWPTAFFIIARGNAPGMRVEVKSFGQRPYSKTFGNCKMPQSLSQLYVHLIFSTKDRYPFLTDDIRERVHAYLATILRDMGSPYTVVGGVEDHVHILFDMGRLHAAKDFVEQIKRESSKFVKTLRPNLDNFYWQSGYGIFSVSPTHRESVVLYINNQKEHHRLKTFQDEYRDFLNRYGIEFNEQYVWD